MTYDVWLDVSIQFDHQMRFLVLNKDASPLLQAANAQGWSKSLAHLYLASTLSPIQPSIRLVSQHPEP